MKLVIRMKGKIMAEETTETTTVKRRTTKEAGVLSRVWNQAGNTAINTGSVAEYATSTISKGFQIADEALNPTLIDSRVETLNAVAEGIQDLMSMGVDQDEARAYLTRGIS